MVVRSLIEMELMELESKNFTIIKIQCHDGISGGIVTIKELTSGQLCKGPHLYGIF